MHETLIILDFGSQYTQLIARRVREKKVFCKILPYNSSLDEITQDQPLGIILSGSPANVYGPKAPISDPKLFDLGIPVLGICYGLQLIAHQFKGRVHRSAKREYGFAELSVDKAEDFFDGLPSKFTCWMSHGDKIDQLPKDFVALAQTDNSPVAAVANLKRKIYGVQFHPEVVHTPLGHQIIGNFLFKICGYQGDWTPASFVEDSIQRIKEKVQDSKVVLGLSGGVDSSVAAVLIHKAIGKQLTCIFVDNGLLRLNEANQVRQIFKDHFKMNIKMVDAAPLFLKNLSNVSDAEQKRKIIGKTFIDVFAKEAKKIPGAVGRKQSAGGMLPTASGLLPAFLAQGTLYPDVIESVSVYGGPTSMIKSHHNVGGLPKNLKFKLLEPLRELFKDEVREVGKVLGLSKEVIGRHPFPGPGLAVRVLGKITENALDLLRQADAIFIDEIKKARLYDEIWQAFAVFLPVRSVGVMGDERTYENAIALRAVTSQDGMTADWARIPPDVLSRVSNRIINEVRGINRVCYDISSKPPGTIEWE